MSDGCSSDVTARKPDGDRALPHRSRFRGVPQSRVTRLPRPTLSPMTGRHTHEVEHENGCLASHELRGTEDMQHRAKRQLARSCVLPVRGHFQI